MGVVYLFNSFQCCCVRFKKAREKVLRENALKDANVVLSR